VAGPSNAPAITVEDVPGLHHFSLNGRTSESRIDAANPAGKLTGKAPTRLSGTLAAPSPIGNLASDQLGRSLWWGLGRDLGWHHLADCTLIKVHRQL